LGGPNPQPGTRGAVSSTARRTGSATGTSAYAFEALARALAVAGDEHAAGWKALARIAGDKIADPEDRERFDEDYATL
jgi:hypothetical protein